MFTTRPDTIFGASFVAVARRPPDRAGGRGGAIAKAAALHRRVQGAAAPARPRSRPPRSWASTPALEVVHPLDPRLAAAGLHREFRADGLRHRRDFRRSRPRPARLRICEAISSADPARGRGERRLASEPIGDEAESAPGIAVNSHFLDGLTSDAGRGRSHPPRRGGRLGPGHRPISAARLGRVAPALLGHADPDHPLRDLRRGAGAARPAAGRAARGRRLRHARQPARPPPDAGSMSTARAAAARRRARPTRSTRSSIRAGISSASPASPRTGRSTAPRPRSGCRSRNISAASSMRSCTCSTPASGPARCSTSASSAWPSRSRACSRRAWSRTRPTAPATAAGSAPTRSRSDGDDWVQSKAASRSRRGRVEKMSKSKHNTIDPEPILDQLRRRRGALVHAVRQPARARPRMVGRRDRGRRALRPARVAAGQRHGRGDGEDEALERKLHRDHRRGRRGDRGLQFNKAVAQLYELTSAIEKAAPSATRDEAVRSLRAARSRRWRRTLPRKAGRRSARRA